MKKTEKINDWKHKGLIDDYEMVYERYINTIHCDLCNVELTTGVSKFGKCMDHCHISGKFRNVVCKTCNNRLPKQKKSIRKDNSSGHKGITFIKKKKLWCYRDRSNRKHFKKMCKCKITLLTYKFAYLMINNYHK